MQITSALLLATLLPFVTPAPQSGGVILPGINVTPASVILDLKVVDDSIAALDAAVNTIKSNVPSVAIPNVLAQIADLQAKAAAAAANVQTLAKEKVTPATAEAITAVRTRFEEVNSDLSAALKTLLAKVQLLPNTLRKTVSDAANGGLATALTAFFAANTAINKALADCEAEAKTVAAAAKKAADDAAAAAKKAAEDAVAAAKKAATNAAAAVKALATTTQKALDIEKRAAAALALLLSLKPKITIEV